MGCAACATADEDRLYTFRQGDDFGQRFENSTSTVTYDPASLQIQIRRGDSISDRLVASFPAVTGSILIDETGTDLLGPTPKILQWAIPGADTESIAPTDGFVYYVAFKARVDGVLMTIHVHSFCVEPQIVRVPAP